MDKVDYPPTPGNYKYHSIDDLERLKLQLEAEIRDISGINHWSDLRGKVLEESKRMLHEVECEILERTLLQCPTDGGASS